MTKIEEILRFAEMPNPAAEAVSIIEKVKDICDKSVIIRFRLSLQEIERFRFADTLSRYGAEKAFHHYSLLVRTASRNAFDEKVNLGPGLTRIDSLLSSGFPRGDDPVSFVLDPSCYEFKNVLGAAIRHDLLWTEIFDDMIISYSSENKPVVYWKDRRTNRK